MSLGLPLGVEGSRPEVVVTTTMLRDMVVAVAGDDVEVRGLMGPGIDPHSYKATSGDIRALRRANLIFYNGLHLEGRMQSVFERMGDRAVAVTDSLPRNRLLQAEDYEGQFDPHVWLDPRLWAECVEVVVAGLSRVLPERAEAFRERGDRVRKEILAEYDWGVERLSRLPEERRILATSHDAFHYFGRAFSFQVVAVQGVSTAGEAGLADITAIIDFLQANRVSAVFLETSVSPAAMERVSRDAGVRIGGELFSDALGGAGERRSGLDGVTYEVGTWQGMFRYNIDTILAGLLEAQVGARAPSREQER